MIATWSTKIFVLTCFLKGLQSHAEIVSDLTSYGFYLGNFLSFGTVFVLKHHASKILNLDFLCRRDYVLKEKNHKIICFTGQD